MKAGHKIEVSTPQRGEKKDLVTHALTNAREALGRKLADTATQARLLEGLSNGLGLPRVPKRIEVYDNSHIQGTNAVGAMIVAGPEGFLKNQYRKFNIKSEGLAPITAPRRLPMPPRMIISSTAPDSCQESSSGFTAPSFTASRKPARPASAPAITNAASLYG